MMKATHVVNINQRSHTGIGIYKIEVTDNSEPKPYPDFRPRKIEYRRSATGEIMFVETRGIGIVPQWADSSGTVLDNRLWQLECTPVERFYCQFGGSEFCTIE